MHAQVEEDHRTTPHQGPETVSSGGAPARGEWRGGRGGVCLHVLFHRSMKRTRDKKPAARVRVGKSVIGGGKRI